MYVSWNEINETHRGKLKIHSSFSRSLIYFFSSRFSFTFWYWKSFTGLSAVDGWNWLLRSEKSPSLCCKLPMSESRSDWKNAQRHEIIVSKWTRQFRVLHDDFLCCKSKEEIEIRNVCLFDWNLIVSLSLPCAVVPPLSSSSEMLEVSQARNSVFALRNSILRELIANLRLQTSLWVAKRLSLIEI